jgi:predicted transcriptional regulator
MADDDNMEQVGFRLPPESVRRIERIAEGDDRTVSQLLRKWVLERLEKERR